MKLDEAIALGKSDYWREAQVRVSPSNREYWFVMLQDAEFKSFILADNNDDPIETDDMNILLDHIRCLGLKQFTVFL